MIVVAQPMWRLRPAGPLGGSGEGAVAVVYPELVVQFVKRNKSATARTATDGSMRMLENWRT